MSAAMVFLIAFSAAWLAVAGSTATHLMRPRRTRGDISLLARAGLLIWLPGVIAATFAEVRHWPAREIGQMHAVGSTCKLTGFALLIAGLALQARSRRTARPGSRTRPGSRRRRARSDRGPPPTSRALLPWRPAPHSRAHTRAQILRI
jgi:hypothetical protein